MQLNRKIMNLLFSAALLLFLFFRMCFYPFRSLILTRAKRHDKITHTIEGRRDKIMTTKGNRNGKLEFSEKNEYSTM